MVEKYLSSKNNENNFGGLSKDKERFASGKGASVGQKDFSLCPFISISSGDPPLPNRRVVGNTFGGIGANVEW